MARQSCDRAARNHRGAQAREGAPPPLPRLAARLAQPVNANANAAAASAAAASTAAASTAAATAHATNAHAAANARQRSRPPASPPLPRQTLWRRRRRRRTWPWPVGRAMDASWVSQRCWAAGAKGAGCRRAIRGQGSEAREGRGGRSSVGTASSTPQKKSGRPGALWTLCGPGNGRGRPIESQLRSRRGGRGRRARGARADPLPRKPGAAAGGWPRRRPSRGQAGAAPLEATAVAVLTTAGEGAVEEREEEERADKGTSPTPTLLLRLIPCLLWLRRLSSSSRAS